MTAVSASGRLARRPAAPGGAVALVLPPLVESNFGNVYPSLPVLAGFLRQHGLAAAQVDLNESFAEYLLSPAALTALARGGVPGFAADTVACAAARWVLKERERLLDDHGRLSTGIDGRRDHAVAYVAELLAGPFNLDPDLAAITGTDGRAELRRMYRTFYRSVAAETRIPPDAALIGISIPMGPQLVPGLLLAAYLKRFRPEARIVLGGATLSLLAPDDLETLLGTHRDVDCVVRYDGEFPLLELYEQAAARDWRPDIVPGVSVWHNGRALHCPPAPGPKLDFLPPPHYATDMLARLPSPVLGVTQARGCYWGKCDYCDFVEVYEGSPAYRGRRPANFLNEVEELLAATGVRRFRFITESIPPAFARRLSELIIQRRLEIAWSSFAMVDRRFDQGLLELMVRAGCERLIVGLETMNTRVLKLVHKSADREENIRFIKDAQRAGMRLTVNIIPDLPSTTYEEAMDTLTDLTELAERIDELTIFHFEATRSSRVGRAPESFGLVRAGSAQPGQAQYEINRLPATDPAMTDDERREVFGRFHALAARHRLGRRARDDTSAGLGLDSRVRIPVESLDVVPVGDELLCTNFERRERFRVPSRLASALAPFLDGRSFTVTDLGIPTDSDRLLNLAHQFQDAGLLDREATTEGR